MDAIARVAPKVAVVEDDAAVRHSLRYTLEAHGYAVRTFTMAEEALRSEEILLADALLIDLALPDLDGLSLLERLRRRGVSSPAIVLASNLAAADPAALRANGAVLIEKPIAAHALEEALRAVLVA